MCKAYLFIGHNGLGRVSSRTLWPVIKLPIAHALLDFCFGSGHRKLQLIEGRITLCLKIIVVDKYSAIKMLK